MFIQLESECSTNLLGIVLGILNGSIDKDFVKTSLNHVADKWAVIASNRLNLESVG